MVALYGVRALSIITSITYTLIKTVLAWFLLGKMADLYGKQRPGEKLQGWFYKMMEIWFCTAGAIPPSGIQEPMENAKKVRITFFLKISFNVLVSARAWPLTSRDFWKLCSNKNWVKFLFSHFFKVPQKVLWKPLRPSINIFETPQRSVKIKM